MYSIPEVLYHVAVRKNGLDNPTPWWQAAYYRWVYMPFQRFSFRVFCIPAPNQLKADGSFSYLEGIGIGTTREQADAMCASENYRVSALPVNTALPERSVDWTGQWWPRAGDPERYQPPGYPMTAVPREDLTKDLQTVLELSARVDGIRTRMRSNSS